MVLSVIIVHYRVPYFLELCLRSLEKALKGLEAEVIVVDNHSADGSVGLLRPMFPKVTWIENPANTGFASANNLGLRKASGEFILFLNPDTIVPEDFARSCLSFLQTAASPGALGVRMIDGSGHFLKESRRGFPTPWVAFCRLTGLTALFPRSRRFAGYYLGNISTGHTHHAPVISGACMLVSRRGLNKTGAFDETFFMYGEDIDLSYRLEKAGYTNYYFPEITIIHFKGESTQKNIRYTRQFYKAMIQFRRKHFRKGLPGLFLLEPAIWLRAGLSAIRKAIARPGGNHREMGRRSWLTGDPAVIAQLRAAFPTAAAPTAAFSAAPFPRTLAADTADADEIIYCIGNDFSFRSAIEALEKKDPAKTAAFYVAGGRAVIRSTRSDKQGEIWIL